MIAMNASGCILHTVLGWFPLEYGVEYGNMGVVDSFNSIWIILSVTFSAPKTSIKFAFQFFDD